MVVLRELSAALVERRSEQEGVRAGEWREWRVRGVYACALAGPVGPTPACCHHTVATACG